MGLKRKKSKGSGPAKTTSSDWPVADIIATIAAIDVEGQRANVACKKLMEDHPEVLANKGLTIADYNGKPGQISGGLRIHLDGLVEKNAEVFDMAVAAGLEPENARPGGPKPQAVRTPAVANGAGLGDARTDEAASGLLPHEKAAAGSEEATATTAAEKEAASLNELMGLLDAPLRDVDGDDGDGDGDGDEEVADGEEV